MSIVSKMAWGGLLGGAILLGARGVCLGGKEDAPPAAAVAAGLDADASPYWVITQRNAFRLNPPPPPLEPAKPPPPHLPEVKLSGFMQAGKQWKVLLAVKTDNPDPHGQKLNYYLTLAEGDKKGVGAGDKQGMVELVRLYADLEKVDIINSGTPVTLSMKDNGFESAAPSPPVILPRRAMPVPADAAPPAPPPVLPVEVETAAVPGLSARGVRGAAATAAGGENSGQGGIPAAGGTRGILR
jgi:hypothetical protein